MSDYSTYFAYDVMGDLVFGKPFACLTSIEHRYVPELIAASFQFIYPVAHLPLQSIFRPVICCEPLMNWLGGQVARDGYQFVTYAAACLKERAAKKDEKEVRKDMMHYIINAKDPMTSRPFTQVELEAESSLLIAASADTISSSLAAGFFYLTLPTSQQILRYLQERLRQEFADVSSITWGALKNHTYFRGVIEEILRLSPAIPAELPRTIVEKPGIEIDSEFIPAGTTVGCSAYVLHHNETAYPEPYSFRPERWISLGIETHLTEPSPLQDEEQIPRAREAFCAFSLGSRGCIGKQLAYMELSLALARVLWTFDMRRAAEQVAARTKNEAKLNGIPWHEEEYQIKDVFLTVKDGPVIEFKKL